MVQTISVVVNTRNEGRNLPYALRSVASWTDEIVVVDMDSEDNTVAIAESFGARIYRAEPAGFVEPARAFAVDQATGDWILVLDADELVPLPLSTRLIEIAASDRADIVMCPFRTFMLGLALQATGWGPRQDIHPRFFRRGALIFQPGIHSAPVPKSGSRVLDLRSAGAPTDLAIQHFNYFGFEDFLDRLNRYTTIEAQQALSRGASPSLLKALARGALEVAWRLGPKFGVRDRWRGVYLALLMGVYRLLIHAKLKQLQTVGSEAEIDAAYRREAERLLSDYRNVEPPGT